MEIIINNKVLVREARLPLINMEISTGAGISLKLIITNMIKSIRRIAILMYSMKADIQVYIYLSDVCYAHSSL